MTTSWCQEFIIIDKKDKFKIYPGLNKIIEHRAGSQKQSSPPKTTGFAVGQSWVKIPTPSYTCYVATV